MSRKTTEIGVKALSKPDFSAFGPLRTFIREAYRDPVWIVFTILFNLVLWRVVAFYSTAVDQLASIQTELLVLESFDSQFKLVRQIFDHVAKSSRMTSRAVESAHALDANRLSDKSYFPQIREVVKEIEDARQAVAFTLGMLDAVDFTNPALAKFKPLYKRYLECSQKNLQSVEALYVALLSQDHIRISRAFDGFTQALRDFRACSDTFDLSSQDFDDSVDNAIRENGLELERVEIHYKLFRLKNWLAWFGILYLDGFAFAVWIAWFKRIRRASVAQVSSTG